MFNANELELIRETLRKCHVDSALIDEKDIKDKIKSSLAVTGADNYNDLFFANHKLSQKTMYNFTDSFGCSYTYFITSKLFDNAVFIIGPYLNENLSTGKILEYAEKNAISPKYRRYLEEFYFGTAVIPKDSILFVMLDSFCERLWNTPAFAIVDVNNEHALPPSPIGSIPKEENFDETLANMKAMEKRYKYENELINSVTKGQLYKDSIFTGAFSEMLFERRVSDPLRNAKNYLIIMNTLLRKAAEAGGVHPVYIDRVSSEFAKKIEHISFSSEIVPLMREIYKAYCLLVQNHTMFGLSELIKNTILLIDSDISAPLAPSDLARTQNVSLGYLSTLFKKEIGKTLTEYIKDKRIAHAKYLLTTTQLQIQTVALHCGIVDLQYFSKIFKKNTGKTPKQYRETNRKN